MKPHIRLTDLVWLGAILWGSSIFVAETSSQLSATFDETFYLKSGMTFWRDRTNAEMMRAGTMPLPIHLQSLPVYIWEQFREKPFDTTEDYGQILSVMRSTNLGFWWLLLIYVYRMGLLFGNQWVARIATSLCAFDPNLLTHASLATTDIASTATLLIFAYHFAVNREKGWWSRVGLSSLLYALALCAKLSALSFAPLTMLAMEFPRLVASYRSTTAPNMLKRLQLSTSRFRWDILQIMIFGFWLSVFYCGTDFKTQKSFVKWAAGLEESTLKTTMVACSENIKIFPNAGEAYAYQIKHNFRGHGSYICQKWHPRAVWYYFPVALTMKMTPVALICLLVVGVFRPRMLIHPLGLTFLFLLAFSLNSRVQIGIRFMFPLMCFAFLTSALGIVNIVGRFSERIPRGTIAIVWIALLASQLVSFGTSFPRGLSYINSFWGGINEGHLLLGDSNIDWGQDYFRLREWQQEHNVDSVRIWYFGSDPRVTKSPDYLPLHNYDNDTVDTLKTRLKGRWIAVSSTLLYGDPGITPKHTQAKAFLLERQPDARAGAFFLYNFTNE